MNIELITLPTIEDPSGNLSVVEKDTIPFAVKRVYYLYDIRTGAKRGGHSHIAQSELLVAVSGSFTVVLKDGRQQRSVTLSRPDEGLLIGTGIWRELEGFSSGAVCLVLASGEFEERDYIRDYNAFLASSR